jgi:hypothetical protein
MIDIRCELCGEPVDPDNPGTWQAATVWRRSAGIRPSGKQGGSDSALPKWQQQWAHPWCVDKAQAGVLGQESLL